MRYCKRCVTPSTRPRIQFDSEGVCNACRYADTKRITVDWDKKWKELETLCNRFRERDKRPWNVLVPCSGGKDGSYVAWRLKHDLGMNPLCVTLVPQIPTTLGRHNLENFKRAGFDHLLISPNPKVYRRLALRGFKEQGRPKMPFVSGISTAVLKIAINLGTPFVMYGEEGEAEYGGSSRQVGRDRIDRNYLIDFYYSGHDPAEYLDEFSRTELGWWSLPDQGTLDDGSLFPTHWSKFEDWDPGMHVSVVERHCGFQRAGRASHGTYTDYAQLDDVLQDLHVYMMFVKFGFGRATSDASIDIRHGKLSREKAVEIVKHLDGSFPQELLLDFLAYFDMNEQDFWKVIDGFVNHTVLEKQAGGCWGLKPLVVHGLETAEEFEP